jgi:tRNA A-37 threonylcarbamoyl transferase component Bud32
MAEGDDAIPPTVASAGAGDHPERLAAGARAGEYVIEAHVGAGAMGDVYRARHPVIGKRVAIKVLKRRLADSPEALERFVREARAVNRIDHPNVADVFAMGRLEGGDGRLWLAMSYLEGEPLGRRIRSGGPLAPEAAVEILRPVCEALAAAHGQGVIHRDLKADNIFLARPGGGSGVGTGDGTGAATQRVYVLDFGIAKVLADVAADTQKASPASLTAEGAWIGTPAYMAPEQWTSEGVTARTDVYALGVVAYEMLTGHPPFSGTSLPALMEQHFRAEPPAMSTPSGGVRVPEAFEAVIRRALAKSPEDRPASAMEFLVECERALGITTAGRSPGAAPATVTAAGGGGRGGRGLVLAGGLVGAGALGLAAVLAFGGGRARESHQAAGPSEAQTGVTLTVVAEPRQAEVLRDGQVVGTGTTIIKRLTPGESVTLELRHIGYRTTRQTIDVRDDQTVEVALDPVEGFEGVWRIPSGELRRFEHSGTHVDGYAPRRVGEPGAFLRRFSFVKQDGDMLVFSATAPNEEPRAPDEPSCQMPLATEYRYDAAHDTLVQRRQRVTYDVRHGRCEPRPGGTLDPVWTEWEASERLARGSSSVVAESRAGGGAPQVNVITPGPSKDPVGTNQDEKGKGRGKPAPKASEKDQQLQKLEDKEDPALEQRGYDQRDKQAPSQQVREPEPQPEPQKKAPPKSKR